MNLRTTPLLLSLVLVSFDSTARAFAPTSGGIKPSNIAKSNTLFSNPSNAPKFRGGSSLDAAADSGNIVTNRFLPAIGSVVAAIYAALAELSLFQKTLFATVFGLGFWIGRVPPFWKAYRDVMEIPKKYFGPNAPVLTGRAVSVSDGDTIRFYHLPLFWQKLPPGKMKVSKVALPVRLCTIDTPETAKFGKPGQPFGPEAKAELKKLLEEKTIKVRLLQKDQYGRAVAQVMTGGALTSTHADEHMLKQGLAEVYTGGGAVYGPKGLDGYLELQSEAQEKKIGIWSQKKRESAAEYKKRTK